MSRLLITVPLAPPHERKPLAPQQQKLLDFVKSQKRWPTHRCIAEHMGWLNDNSVGDALLRIAFKGHLGFERRIGAPKSYRWFWHDETPAEVS